MSDFPYVMNITKNYIFCIFLNSLWTYKYLHTVLFVNLFLLANIPILYPLKTPENHRLPVVFRGGCKMGALVVNELIIIKGNIIMFIRA